MSVKQLESAIAALPPNERREFVHWLDDHRHELIGETDDLSKAQTAELLRRRQEYDEHPERFVHMDKISLDQMFNRIRKNVAARISPAR